MHRLSVLVISLALCLDTVNGQVERKYSGQGYFFTGLGATSPGSSTTLHFGGGGDVFIYKGLGAGAELGYLAPTHYLREGLGVLSTNGSYHLVNPQSGRKVLPFVTGGYTLMFREGRANLFNVGGGADIWFGRSVGLRLEFRDHVWRSEGCPTVHYWGVRAGVVLR